MSAYFGQLPINGMMYNGQECSAMYNGNLIWPTATPLAGLPWSASGSLNVLGGFGGLDPLTGTIVSLSENSVDFLMAESPDSFYCTSRSTTYISPTSTSGTVMQSGYIHSSLSFYYSATIDGSVSQSTGWLYKPSNGFVTDLSQASASWSTNGTDYTTCFMMYPSFYNPLTVEYRLSAESGRFHGPKTAAQYPVDASTISAYMPYAYISTPKSGHRSLTYTSFWSASGVYIPE